MTGEIPTEWMIAYNADWDAVQRQNLNSTRFGVVLIRISGEKISGLLLTIMAMTK
jgi:hypothetical protein